MLTLYNVVSADGFIARKNGEEDFIPDELWSYALELYQKYDALVMGRKTYDAIQAYDRQSIHVFENLKIKKAILTSNKTFTAKEGYTIIHTMKEIFVLGKNILVSSGPNLNTQILEGKCADKVIIYKLPVIISDGVKPFSINTESLLQRISEIKNSSGTITIYKVIK